MHWHKVFIWKYTLRWHDCQNNKNNNKSCNFLYNFQITKVTQKNLKAKSKRELLKCGDIESNPGPEAAGEIKEYSKLKRVLNLCAKKVKSTRFTIVNLQETHLDKEDLNRVELLWRGGFSLSPGTNKSRGCITLWGSAWDEVESLTDNQGRISCSTLRNNTTTISIINIYAPNDHSVQFYEEVFTIVINVKEKYEPQERKPQKSFFFTSVVGPEFGSE